MDNTQPQLKKQSVLLTCLLILVTAGLYYPIWFLMKRKELNTLESTKKISTWSPGILFLLYSISMLSWLVFVLPGLFAGIFAALFVLSIPLDSLVIPIWILVLSFRTRRILKDNIKLHSIPDARVSGFLTFLFSIIYLQYKINKIEDVLKGENQIVN